MKTIYSNRALSILFNFIKGNNLVDYTIIIPSNICHDVYFVLESIGMNIVFVDIDKSSLEQSITSSLDSVMSNKKVILLWNHQYGIPDSPYDFFELVKLTKTETIIIDDRCLCNASEYEFNVKDMYVDLILYSTGYGKQVELNHGAFGIYQDFYFMSDSYNNFNEDIYINLKEELAHNDTNVSVLKDGIKNVWQGVNYDSMSICQYKSNIIRENTKWSNHKEQIKNIFSSGITTNIKVSNKFNNWRYHILVKNKSILLKKIFDAGLFASGHYPSIGSIIDNREYPNAEWLHRSVINLFIDKHYTVEDANRTVEIINKYGIL